MHPLVEAETMMRLIRDADGLSPPSAADVRVVRVSLVLQSLASTDTGRRMTLVPAYRRLHRADDDGLLQVFLDRDGVTRGHAILALMEEVADAQVRADPLRLIDLALHTGGDRAWLIALSGGVGQGRSIARHLSDNALSSHADVTFIKRINGKTMLKTASRPPIGPFARPAPLELGATPRFREYRLSEDRIRLFGHYAAIMAAGGDGDQTLASASETFAAAFALRQFAFDERREPRAFLSWAMLDRKAVTRLEAFGIAGLRPCDWRCGTTPCLIEVIGDERHTEPMLKQWHRSFRSENPARLLVDPGTAQARVVNAG
jgi:hemolysin-activating ACP:hemolysin acyltransferase